MCEHREDDKASNGSDQIAFVYFDLGNILYSFNTEKACQNVAMRCDVNANKVYSVVYESGLQVQYESGRIRQDAFVNRVRSNLGIHTKELSDSDLLNLLSDMFSPIELMHEAILQVRAKGIPTGILSNTCRSHWDWINCLPSRAMLDGFDAYVLSYEVGEMKPFGAIYEAAEQAAEVPSNQILFLDDRLENIQAAQARGWRAECCFGGVEAREVLVNYGFMLDRN